MTVLQKIKKYLRQKQKALKQTEVFYVPNQQRELAKIFASAENFITERR